MAKERKPIGADVICGFSFSFCVALLKKLRELIRTKKVLVLSGYPTKRPAKFHVGEETVYKLTPIAGAIVNHLSSQIGLGETNEHDFTTADIEKYMAVAQEFLDIFKPKL